MIGGGVTLAGFMTRGSGGTPRTTTWTNMTEQTDRTVESEVSMSSAMNKSAATSSVTITATASGALDFGALVAATFKPL